MSKCPEEPEDRVGRCFLSFSLPLLSMPISLFPLLSLERIFIYPYFLPGIQALESSAVMLQQIGCCTAVGDSTLLGQVLSNLTFWNTCLNIVQSSLVTVGWYGWVGQDRIFKAALCQIVLANFLAVLHGLFPDRKKEEAGRACLPQRGGIWKGSWSVSWPGLAACRYCGNRSWLLFNWSKSGNEKGLHRQKRSSQTGNYGLTLSEFLFSFSVQSFRSQPLTADW